MNRNLIAVAITFIGVAVTAIGCSDDERAGDGAVADTLTPDATDIAEVSDGDIGPEEGIDSIDGDSAAPIDAIDTLDPIDTVDTVETADASDSDVPDGPSRGEFNVGFTSDSVTYEPADGSGPRTLRVVYWYPTRAMTGDSVLYAGLLPAPGVLGGAAPVTDRGTLPVVIFSHGNTSFAEQSFFFTEFLASHGYLVVAMDHTGNTFGGEQDIRIFHWRPMDISAVIDHIQALSQDAPLAPLVGDAIAVSGHSFGGYTTLAAGGARWDVDLILAYCVDNEIPLDGCSSIVDNEAIYRGSFLDPRIDALIPMAPGASFTFGASGIEQITLPTLLVTAGLDQTTTEVDDGDPTWAQLAHVSSDNLRIDFATGGHFTFSDACSLPLGIGDTDGCGPANLPAAAAHEAVNAYALAFLDRHLRGVESNSALLDGTLRIEPDVTFSHGNGPAGPE